jgi:hypothetical protein
VDSVENLSTEFVDKLPMRRCYVDDVEKLSTTIVEKLHEDRNVPNLVRNGHVKYAAINVAKSKTYPHSLWISR